MSFGQGHLDPRQFQNVQQSLDSTPRLYQDHPDLHAQPPSSAALVNPSRFDDFSFPYQTLRDQNSFIGLDAQSNVPHSADSFPNDTSMTGIDGSHAISTGPVHNLNFNPGPPDHRRPSMAGSDDGAPDSISPMVNSLDDTIADEFGLSSQNRLDVTDLGGKGKEDKADAAPAWSELKTKAGKERKRLPLACIACRRKKIRCSGEKPACKHCSRSRTPCVYKVTARKAAPRTDYMAMLDKRLKRMEDRIIKVIPEADQEAATSSVTRAVVKPAIPGTLPTKSSVKKRSAEEAFGRDLAVWASAPPKSQTSSDDRPNSLQVQEAEENKLFQEGADALPSKEIQEHLAEVFFDNIYGQAYHLLHKPSYMRKLKNNTLPPVLILSVCAVAVRFTTNPNLASSTTPQFLRGEEWASHARDICTRRYDWPNLTILTCLLILGLHEFGTCQGGRSWALGGQAIRMAFALQLHKDLEYDPTGHSGEKVQLSFIDREIRRRIMWACFLMDRFNSSGTDRPMFIREDTIKIPLPIKERLFQLDMPAPTETLNGQVLQHMSPVDGKVIKPGQNMGVAAYMIRSIALWGRIITYLNQGGREMDPEPVWSDKSEYAKLINEALALYSNLPVFLQYSPDNVEVHRTETTAGQFLFLHISIQQNILFLCRAAVSTSDVHGHPEAFKDFFSRTSAKMFTAANQISNLLREAETSGLLVSAPFAGYCAFCSATVHILGLVSRNPSIKPTAEAHLAINVKFLQKMKKYWGMFHWMIEEVRSQYRQALESLRTGNPANKSTTDSPILQYGDWFNRYPHGLSDTEFMDPATQKRKENEADAVLEAKPELQSVGEYFSTLSPAQSNDSKDNQGTGMSRRKSVSKKQSAAPTRPMQQIKREPGTTTPTTGPRSSDQVGVQARQPRRFSGALGSQASGSATFNTLSIPPHSQNPTFNTMSSMSPVNMPPFPQQTPTTTFFSPDMLPMNLNPQASGLLQPLDRQLVFGGHSMNTSEMIGGQNMMNGVDWNSMAMGNQADGNTQSHRASVSGVIGGQQGQVPTTTMAGLNGQEASSAWFMPFNMEPPEMTQDMGLGVGNVDTFGGMFSGGGSGMTTPNPLGGLRHGP